MGNSIFDDSKALEDIEKISKHVRDRAIKENKNELEMIKLIEQEIFDDIKKILYKQREKYIKAKYPNLRFGYDKASKASECQNNSKLGMRDNPNEGSAA